MRGDLIRRPFAVHFNYANPIIRQRARALLLMNWLVLSVVLAFAVLSPLTNYAITEVSPSQFWVLIVISLIVLAVTYLLIQTGRYTIAVWVFLAIMLITLIPATVSARGLVTPVGLLVPLVAAGILLDRRGLLAMIALIGLILIARAVNQSHILTSVRYVPADIAISELTNYMLYFGLATIFLLVFVGGSERVGASSANDVERLRAVLRFAERLEDVRTESFVLTRALEVLQADLGFDLAQFYLSDDTGMYTRRVRLGLGQSESGTRITLRPGDESVIAEAIATREPVIVTTSDGGALAEHLVAPARQSITQALVYNNVVLGILDVQSERRALLNSGSVTSLRNLTSQVARELAQVRHIDELERSVRDQENIINRFLNQMTELQQRTQSAAGNSWSRYMQGRAQSTFGFDYESGALLAATDLPDEIREAVQQGDIFVTRQNGSQQVNVPILLRSQVLGALTFTIPGEHAISERQIEMLRTIASRLGIALESNRLLEQTQSQAQRERKASELSSLLLSATEVDAVLDLAASNFNDALGAVRTRVYIEPSALTASGEQS